MSLNGWEFIFHDITKLLREYSKMKQIYCWMTNISSTTETNVRNKLIYNSRAVVHSIYFELMSSWNLLSYFYWTFTEPLESVKKIYFQLWKSKKKKRILHERAHTPQTDCSSCMLRFVYLSNVTPFAWLPKYCHVVSRNVYLLCTANMICDMRYVMWDVGCGMSHKGITIHANIIVIETLSTMWTHNRFIIYRILCEIPWTCDHVHAFGTHNT